MTEIKAVIYSHDETSYISMRDWQIEFGQVGISELKPPAPGDDDLMAQLFRDMNVEIQNLGGELHVVRGSGTLDRETRTPHLLVFEFANSLWIARGFKVLGNAAPDAPRVRMIVRTDDDVTPERWDSLYAARVSAGGDVGENEIQAAGPAEADRSIAYPLESDSEPIGGQNATEYGDMADGDD